MSEAQLYAYKLRVQGSIRSKVHFATMADIQSIKKRSGDASVIVIGPVQRAQPATAKKAEPAAVAPKAGEKGKDKHKNKEA